MARGQIIQFGVSPTDPHLAGLKDELQRALGRVTNHATVPLHQNYAGTTIALSGGAATCAAMGAVVDHADAGGNLCRCVVYGTPPAAHDATVQVYNVTTGQVMASVTMPAGAPAGSFAGSWTGFTPAGGDENLQVRIVGTGSDNVVLNSVHHQFATANLKP